MNILRGCEVDVLPLSIEHLLKEERHFGGEVGGEVVEDGSGESGGVPDIIII